MTRCLDLLPDLKTRPNCVSRARYATLPVSQHPRPTLIDNVVNMISKRSVPKLPSHKQLSWQGIEVLQCAVDITKGSSLRYQLNDPPRIVLLHLTADSTQLFKCGNYTVDILRVTRLIPKNPLPTGLTKLESQDVCYVP